MREVNIKTKMSENITINPNIATPEAQHNILDELNINTEVLIDQEDFARTRFQIPGTDAESPVFIEFRGKEELPITPDSSTALHVAITGDERPVHTGNDRFGDWLLARTGDASKGDVVIMESPVEKSMDSQLEKVWTAAMENHADEVVIHAPATPKGIIDSALVIAIQNGKKEAVEKIIEMRRNIENNDYSPYVTQLMQRVVDVPAMMDGGEAESGLMIVAMALAGDADAEQEVINSEQKMRVAYLGFKAGEIASDNEIAPAEPGSTVDQKAIQHANDSGIVGVHTTETRPLQDKFLRSTAQFNQGTTEQFPRDTVHFSMNHTVESHFGGSFSNRPYTIVSPFGGLLEANGAPGAMADVDTYFTNMPGEAVILPIGTKIIEMTESAERPGLYVEGDSITINKKQLETTQGISSIAEEFVALFPSIYHEPGDPIDVLARVLEKNSVIDLRNDLRLVRSTLENDMLLGSEIHEKAAEEEASLVQAIGEHQDREENVDLAAILRDPASIEGNDLLHTKLAEAFRIAVVNATIKGMGGSVVEGGSHYTYDSKFQQDVNSIAAEIGVTSGLHANAQEGLFERFYLDALRAGMVTETIEGKSVKKDFDWTEYSKSNSGMLYSMRRLAPATRVRAADMGIITYAHRAYQEDQDMSEVSLE